MNMAKAELLWRRNRALDHLMAFSVRSERIVSSSTLFWLICVSASGEWVRVCSWYHLSTSRVRVLILDIFWRFIECGKLYKVTTKDCLMSCPKYKV